MNFNNTFDNYYNSTYITMSLNKFKDAQTGIDLGLKVGCNELKILADDLTTINFKTPDQGNTDEVLTSDGAGNTYFSSKTLISSAWNFFESTTVSIGSPIVVTQGTTAILTNNGLGVQTNTEQKSPTNGLFYDTTLNRITPEFDGDSYQIDIRINAENTSAIGYFEIDININNGAFILPLGVETFPIGLGVSHTFNKSSAVFVGAIFKQYGGVIQLTSLVGDTTITSIAFLINRLHRAF